MRAVGQLCRPWLAATAGLALMLSYGGAYGGDSTLNKVRSTGTLHCGATARPGLAENGPAGQVGLFVDLCRAISAASLGRLGRIEFHAYDPDAFDRATDLDDVAFLSGSEILERHLISAALPGPTVFYVSLAVMVPDDSSFHRLDELAEHRICFLQGSSAHRALEAWFEAAHLTFKRMGYQENGEMLDAYNVGVCDALAGEMTDLARARIDAGINNLRSRILEQPLAVFPILAVTSMDDGQWAAIVAWTMFTLMRAEAARLNWAAGGVASVPIAGDSIGLASDWQNQVISAVGTYADIFERSLGTASSYRLQRGLNSPSLQGGAMIVPYSE